MNKLVYMVSLLCATLCLTGCSDFFNSNNDTILEEKDYYSNRTELLSGFWGIAQCVQAVADKSIYLEGLRGDLLEPTSNAPQEFWDIYNYKDDNLKIDETSDKSEGIADPKGYYTIILNCNDYLVHLKKFYADNPDVITETKYKGLIGGTLRYKAWAYMMLAKIYGKAIYFDDALTSYSDISNYPESNFNEIIDKCISLIETGTDGIDGKGTISWQIDEDLYPSNSETGVSSDASEMTWNRICPQYQCLLAELYLWKASKSSESETAKLNDYQQVWNYCISLITEGGTEDVWQLNLSDYNGEWSGFFGSQDMNRFEDICVAFYDYQNNQTNHLETYFSNISSNKYYLRPSSAGMAPFKNQLQTDGTYGKDTYRGNKKTYYVVNGDTVLYKYMQNYLTSAAAYKNDALVPLYRAADIHMFLAESLVGMGRFEEALTFLNGGIKAYYSTATSAFIGAFANYPTCLYQTPNKSSNGACQGIRGRVTLGALGSDVTDSTSTHYQNKQYLDSILVEETRLEFSAESRSYYSMLRQARLWGDAVRTVWADKVAAKYTNGYASTIKSRLENSESGWFINYDLK